MFKGFGTSILNFFDTSY